MVGAGVLYAQGCRFESGQVNKKNDNTMERLQHWRRPDGTRIAVPIEDEVRSVLIREKTQGNKLKVCIGTDSQVKGTSIEYATVIVFLRQGKGGFMYVLPETTHRKM